MTKFDISKFSPCAEGVRYYENKASFEEAWRDCERGDWMLWIAHKLDIDCRALTRAKALCANTVRHLMKDKRSTDAIDAALRYADGKISENDLRAAHATAAAAAAAAHAAADDATHAAAATAAATAASAYTSATSASHAAHAAAATAYNAAYAATHAASVTSATSAIDAAIEATTAAIVAENAARKTNQLQTADVCREVLTDAVFEKIKNKET